MNIPAFTAEAALYKNSGYYRASQCKSFTRAVKPIWPAAEIIEVHGCNAGFIQVGEWPNAICVPDPNLTGTGSDDQGDGPSDNGGPTGTGTRPPKGAPRGSHACTPDDPSVKANPQSWEDCGKLNVGQDTSKSLHEAWCAEGGKMWCCVKTRANNTLSSCKSVHDGRIDLGGSIPIGGGITFKGVAI